ncbi:long-chain fatty acid--CoA ligase [Variovorax sp. H27-G14]|uniref:long-chain fatty acid--CoA ligase n=1 Tax=Variovorax sp. H27-G14 TaxID=3111914 RepID=UPI0038FC5874
MSSTSLNAWPGHAPRSLPLPQTHLYRNVEIAALRYGERPFVLFYDSPLTFQRFKDETEHMAGFLQSECGVRKGDRVLLYMQNSPQFMLAFYAILRADAVVVPINPMNVTAELEHLAKDSGARVAFAAQDLLERIRPLLGDTIDRLVVATYSDYLEQPTDLKIPDFVMAPRATLDHPRSVAWTDALAQGCVPGPLCAGPDDLAVLPYTSGTTGQPKGCMHTHRTTMVNAVTASVWFNTTAASVTLSVLPMFHVTGMQSGLNGPLYVGSTVVVLPRWDREAAAESIARYRVTSLGLISTMAIDFMANPKLGTYDFSSLRHVGGGGASMPRAVAQAMSDRLGIGYAEGYGLSETMGATHLCPPGGDKLQCLGIPLFDVDARVVDPDTCAPVEPGAVGEILVHAPQLMRGYWNNPAADDVAFVQIGDKRFFRTGDLASTDAQGFFVFADRLKRMINASGFKVWPAEVESKLYQHPAVQEACVIASGDARRGETVKALVVLRPAFAGQVTEDDLIQWSREHMAVYKCPRIISFVMQLPKSATGKVNWRALQDAEKAGTS